MADTGYSTTAPLNGSGGIIASGDQQSTGKTKAETTDYWTLEQCKQAYLDYTGSKSLELQEIKEARRYRHHSQWTKEQIDVFNKRKQPVVTLKVGGFDPDAASPADDLRDDLLVIGVVLGQYHLRHDDYRNPDQTVIGQS